MLHEVINIDIDYEKLGIKHDDSKATITTYIKDIFPKDQLPFSKRVRGYGNNHAEYGN